MADFKNYSPENIICENLRETATRLDMILLQEQAHLRELALELVKDSDAGRELIASLPDLIPTDPFEENGASDPIRSTVRRVIFCREVAERIAANERLLPEWLLPEPDGESTDLSRIAYQRSSYADAAYLAFAPLLSDPRASYVHSFPSACEDVYNGLCEFCILPLENSSEGQLSSFTRLIDRYGLKIAATADVSATDGSRTTCFALLRRAPLPLLGDGGSPRLLEISLRPGRADSLSEILHAARLCGLTLSRINTRVDPDESDLLVHPIFSADDDRLALFLLYLATAPYSYEIVGLFPHLCGEEKRN